MYIDKVTKNSQGYHISPTNRCYKQSHSLVRNLSLSWNFNFFFGFIPLLVLTLFFPIFSKGSSSVYFKFLLCSYSCLFGFSSSQLLLMYLLFSSGNFIIWLLLVYFLVSLSYSYSYYLPLSICVCSASLDLLVKLRMSKWITQVLIPEKSIRYQKKKRSSICYFPYSLHPHPNPKART